MYATTNFKSKKALVEAVKSGAQIGVYSPGPFPCPTDGRVSLEGPWFPQPHRWYAQAEVKSGIIVKVK